MTGKITARSYALLKAMQA